jgi:transcriptional regulator with XRE-family HTH domain
LETLGDQILERRLDLKLTVRELGKNMGVTMSTVYKWEYRLENPHRRLYAEIVKFLGYEPDIFVRRYLGEKILAYRKLHGNSQRQLALMLGVHKTTLRQWEKDRRGV